MRQEATKKSDACKHLLGTGFQLLSKICHETSIFQPTAQESVRESHDGEGKNHPRDKPLHLLCLTSVLKVNPKAKADWRDHTTPHFSEPASPLISLFVH